jgi:hypothetical protein
MNAGEGCRAVAAKPRRRACPVCEGASARQTIPHSGVPFDTTRRRGPRGFCNPSPALRSQKQTVVSRGSIVCAPFGVPAGAALPLPSPWDAGRKAPRLRAQECQSQTPLLRWPHPRRPRPSRPPQLRPLPSHRPIPALGSFTSLSNSPTSGAHSTSNAIGNQAPVARLPGDTSVERHQPVAVQGRWQIHGPDSAEAFGPKYGELVPYLGAAVTTALTPRPAERTLAPADLPISRGSGSSRGSE